MSVRPLLTLRKPKPPAERPAPREMPALDAPQFWFVWVEDRRAPRHRHATEESARRELERLRAVLPGHTIHLFRAARIADAPQSGC